MKDKIIKYYFLFIKLIYICLVVGYIIFNNKDITYTKSIIEISMILILITTIIFSFILEKTRIVFLILALIINIFLIFNFKEQYVLILPLLILEIISYFKLPIYFYLIIFLGAVCDIDNKFIYILVCTFTSIIYFQKYYIADKYNDILNESINNESDLKYTIESQLERYKSNVKQQSLTFENRLLEQKSNLSQALHDKIGHSINGSIYQLEASKLLINNNKEESIKITQLVIDNLRHSLDEIREILRKEKPDKSEISLLRLWKLCEEFNEKYKINAELVINGDAKNVPENIWTIILDNVIEAFSNALKYSDCKNIKVQINILNKIVRCSIIDDGIGSKNINSGMGLLGMKERVTSIGGSIDVNGELGFNINMILPIEHMVLGGEKNYGR